MRALRGILGVSLGVGLSTLAAATLAGAFDRTLPNYDVLPDMVQSVPFDAFAPNPSFPDGMTLRAPVPGTIPRGHMPLVYGPSPEEAARAGRELANPIAPDAAAVERGRKVFAVFCLPCHGAAGEGDGPVTRRGVPPPPSLVTGKVKSLADGQLFHIVTYGQGNMPSYAGQVDREDRWKAIRYIRTMGSERPAGASGASPENAGGERVQEKKP